jgi:hypothetical protein
MIVAVAVWLSRPCSGITITVLEERPRRGQPGEQEVRRGARSQTVGNETARGDTNGDAAHSAERVDPDGRVADVVVVELDDHDQREVDADRGRGAQDALADAERDLLVAMVAQGRDGVADEVASVGPPADAVGARLRRQRRPKTASRALL